MAFALRKTNVPFEDNTVEISTVVCEELEQAGFLNAFSTRLNGESIMPRHALNLSSKDEIPRVYVENKRRFFTSINTVGWRLVTVHQTHSDKRVVVEPPPPTSAPPPANAVVDITNGPVVEQEGDALISKELNTLIGVKTADCLPVLMGDPTTGKMAAIHAGWRGTLQRIIEKTVDDLKNLHGVNPADLVVAIGPSACGDCYEVGPEVVTSFRASMKDGEIFFKKLNTGKFKFSNSQAALYKLGLAGVNPRNVHISMHCTMHENGLFFSHRIESKDMPLVGRLLSVIGKRG